MVDWLDDKFKKKILDDCMGDITNVLVGKGLGQNSANVVTRWITNRILTAALKAKKEENEARKKAQKGDKEPDRNIILITKPTKRPTRYKDRTKPAKKKKAKKRKKIGRANGRRRSR